MKMSALSSNVELATLDSNSESTPQSVPVNVSLKLQTSNLSLSTLLDVSLVPLLSLSIDATFSE